MRPARAALVAASFYIAATIVLTYPLVTGLGRFVPSDPGDPLLVTWVLWWNAHHVPLTASWWNAPAFFPSPDTLALSEHFLGLSLFTTPIIQASGNPQLGYNVAFLLTFILSALGGYALGFSLTRRSDAAFIAGLAYAFAPYRMAQFPHIHVLASYWMPFALAALHEYHREPRTRWLAAFAVAAMLQILTSGYYLLFFPTLLTLWILWFPIAQRQYRRAALIVGAFLVACLPSVPILWHYLEVHRGFGFRRGIGEIVAFSADITALISGPPHLAVWGGVLREPAPEAQLFPGLTVIVLIACALLWTRAAPRPVAAGIDPPWRRWLRRGLLTAAIVATIVAIALPILGAWKLELFGTTLSVRRISRPISIAVLLWLLTLAQSNRVRAVLTSQSTFAFYAVATIVMWVLAFGPHPTFNGERVVYWAPYRWLMLLPGFDGVRVPARFAMLAALTLAAAASVAIARLVVRVPGWARTFAVAGVATCVLADGWFRHMPLIEKPTPSLLTAASEPGGVLELPAGDVDVAAMYRSMVHGHPVANGYSGYFPPIYEAMRSGIESFDPDMLTGLATLGVRHVVVFGNEPASADPWNDYISGFPDARRETTADGQTLYTLSPAPVPEERHVAAPHVPIVSVTADLFPEDLGRLRDGDPDTAWETGAPQAGTADENVTVDLGAATRVSGVELTMGMYRATYPRWLVIERSTDCAAWEIAWQGPTAARTLRSALRDPTTVPIDIRFDPVDARCVRLRQMGNGGKYAWAIGELAIVGATASPAGR
jgi:hypothetical protein